MPAEGGAVAQRTGDSVGRWAWLRPWLVALLGVWLAASIVLVNWADQHGLLQDISFSPYHLPGYAAILVLAGYVLWRFARNARRHGWRRTLPDYYGGLGLGLLFVLGWVVLDIAWRNTLGIDFGIENGIAPPRLLLPAALVVIAAGPLREALAVRATQTGSALDRRTRWAGVVGIGVIGAALTLVAWNPLRDGFQDYREQPGRDLSEIWSMAADGSDQRRLLPAHGDGVDYSLPVYSPSGDRIAYTVWKNGRDEAANAHTFDQTTSIWTMAADGSDRRLLLEGAPDQVWTPAWSPDGAWIAYTFSPQQAPTTGGAAPQANAAPGQLEAPTVRGTGQVWLVAADGTGTSVLLSAQNVDAVSPAWSPDGKALAFETFDASTGSSDIHVAAFATDRLSDERAIAAGPSDEWGASWSPDGQWIAFVSDRSGNDDIWVTRADGTGEPRRLTDDGASDWVPAFSPDGTRIAFVSERTGDSEVWSMAVDGSDQRNLSNHPGYLDGQWSVSWSPDGSRLAYAMAPFQAPESSFIVRSDYAAAEAILLAISLAIVAILLAALAAPLGSFTLVLVLIVALSVGPDEHWEYLVAAVVGGAVVDLVVRAAPARRKTEIAAAALPAVTMLGIGITLGVAQSLAWSLTLLLGVATAAALIGWGLAYAVERLFQIPGEGVVVVEHEA
jgi:TolB protein